MLKECLPDSETWSVFQPYQDFAKVSARFSAQAITGPAFSHNQKWLKLEVDYVENCECNCCIFDLIMN